VNLNLTSSALSMMSATPCILKGARISDFMAEPIAPPAASSAATLLLRQVIAQWRAVQFDENRCCIGLGCVPCQTEEYFME
jgi:hypothetical protein